MKKGLFMAGIFLVVLMSPGLGISESFEETKALAEGGDASAQYSLGIMYYKGEGVPQDYQKAGTWFRKAAEQGNAKAKFNLGVMYGKGESVPQDYQKAIKLFREAAEQGDASAQFNLGVCYFKGTGLKQDYVQAHMWFNLAATNGIEAAAKARKEVDLLMTPKQIAEAQKLARKRFKKGQGK